MTIQFILSSNPDNLAAALAGKKSATVEAEYGDVCVPGSVLTMAHHGPRSGNRAPCMYTNMKDTDIEVVGLSHFDLDSLGGCMALLGAKPEVSGFWELAEFVDLNGAHKLAQGKASPENIRRIWAFWAWEEDNKPWPPRDGSVLDVTQNVLAAIGVLKYILNDDPNLLATGDAYAKAQADLNVNSFIEQHLGVVVRVSNSFVNHLYTDPEGKPHEAVVAFNPLSGEITISFAEKPKTMTAREIVQKLWGELAGGHDAIAGSPRGERLNVRDITDAIDEVACVLMDDAALAAL